MFPFPTCKGKKKQTPWNECSGSVCQADFWFWGLFPFVQAVDLAQTVHPSMGWKGSKRGVDWAEVWNPGKAPSSMTPLWCYDFCCDFCILCGQSILHQAIGYFAFCLVSISPLLTKPITASLALLVLSSTSYTLWWKYMCNAVVWHALSMMSEVVNAIFLVLTHSWTVGLANQVQMLKRVQYQSAWSLRE